MSAYLERINRMKEKIATTERSIHFHDAMQIRAIQNSLYTLLCHFILKCIL
jgi:hypothetical protein